MSGGTRHYDFAKELVKRGHSVTIVASSFHHTKYQEMKKYGEGEYLLEEVDGVKFIWFKTPAYSSNGIGRVINMLSYTLKALKFMPKLSQNKPPDIIVGSSVHLFAVWAAYRLSLRYKVPFIMEVRDLWPQTLIDMGISKWHPFVLLLGVLERYLYKKADKIISNLPYAYDYIGQFAGKEKFVWISNGVDLSNIKYTPKKSNGKFVVSYTGSIGVANNLQLLLDVVKRLKDKTNIYFRIVGDGAEKEKLKQYVEKYQLKNVSLENSVPKNEVTNILQNSDVLFLSLKDSPLYRFGISLNKLFDYMASGRVVVFAGNSKNNPINDANAGYSIRPDDVESLEKTLLEIYSLREIEREDIGKKLRKYCEENYSIKVLVDKFEFVLQTEIDSSSNHS